MYLDDFLARHGLLVDQILEEARGPLNLRPGDILFLCGSLIEGLGNEQSDIDLYLITSRTDIVFNSLHDVILMLGPCLVEVRVKQRSLLEALIERAVRWTKQPRDPRSAFDFSEEERKLLHRLRHGRVLYGGGDFEALERRLALADLARHRLDWARHLAGNLQIDLAGLRGAGDARSMLFVAQEVLAHTIDGLLAGYGFTNPIWKWRVRQLNELPNDWELTLPGRSTGLTAPERYLSLHRAPGDVTPRTILEYALRIVAFSRCVFPWAERRLYGDSVLPVSPVSVTDAAPDGAKAASNEGIRRMPHLDLNVAVLYHEGHFELVRLNGRAAPIEVSAEAWTMLCFFDGETSRAEAVRHAEKLHGADRGAAFIDGLVELVGFAKLEADQMCDEEALAKLLATSAARS
jgi:hypothetical protein